MVLIEKEINEIPSYKLRFIFFRHW